MVLKLSNKVVPAGLQPHEFRYLGRSAHDQGDFGPEVGAVDMLRVDERGVAQGTRYVHLGVVEARGQIFVYMESGRLDVASWSSEAPTPGLEFSFTRCRDALEARRFFRHECLRLNLARLERKVIADAPVWTAKVDARARVEQAWLVRSLGEFVPGLPSRSRPQPQPRATAKLGPQRQLDLPGLAARERTSPRDESTPPRSDLLVRGILFDAQLEARRQGHAPSLAALEQIGRELLPMVVRRIAELSAAPTDTLEPTKPRSLALHTPPRARPKPGRLTVSN